MLTNRRTLIAGSAVLGAAAFAGTEVSLAESATTSITMPTVNRYKVGGFEVTAISDGHRTVEKPETIFGTNQRPEDVASLLHANFLPVDRMAIGFTPVVINTGRERVLFDTGRGEEVVSVAWIAEQGEDDEAGDTAPPQD